MTRTIVVYVALGNRKDDLLVDFANFASKTLTARFILIASEPKFYNNFPGEVLKYEQTETMRNAMQVIHKARRHLRFVSKGYWLFTFERFLALKILEGRVGSSDPILHMENDILSFISDQHLEALRKSFQKTAILRWGNLANGGVTFAPNILALSETIQNFLLLGLKLKKIEEWSLDMRVLRTLLDKKLVEELPTIKGVASRNALELTSDFYFDSQRVVFDGNELGTYLLGRNSIYSNGVVFGGEKAGYTEWPIETTQWMLSTENSSFRLSMKFNNEIFNIPMLHVSSKINLVKNSYENLYNLFPTNSWFDKLRFPTRGVAVESIHLEKMPRRMLRRLLTLFT